MDRTRRHLLLSAAALGPAILFAGRLSAAPKEISITGLEAINQAGRQRMLSQRMAKCYAQCMLGVRNDQAQSLLTASANRFEDQLANLRRFTAAKERAEIAPTYDKLATLWGSYRAAVTAPPSASGLATIARLNEQVLATAHEGTVQLEKSQASSLGKLVNLAGRQRMLSQRMAKFYFFERNGLSSAETTAGLKKARADFVTAFAELKAAPENTAEIRTWLSLADMQWAFFDEAIKQPGASREQDQHVAVTSENILDAMDKLTALYTQLG
ncbi:type IV pili methyl-accepting chemotaxis transducer N-terminal domain-containing protein [Niveibacterium sp. 24ML]|uniref:type IV pili methyl-accepting chemotaxis transducer N-terminal domain-containing protein n=1 Tax=Niveibacterium sp. 24ML TaxID=2985512 RepID=UPI0022708EB2|nr:type IV pili methyl-accepting chemotaxis transducer N-terminal domain-containing protein [Niveibacterium sp. 24ML]MCX9156962.1 type IV pili methyl-accepting chemotaxis transducer N-terminal domain-containing protein [Niveibacterium sp. 24ML]